jgi:hypothetical protein
MIISAKAERMRYNPTQHNQTINYHRTSQDGTDIVAMSSQSIPRIGELSELCIPKKYLKKEFEVNRWLQSHKLWRSSTFLLRHSIPTVARKNKTKCEHKVTEIATHQKKFTGAGLVADFELRSSAILGEYNIIFSGVIHKVARNCNDIVLWKRVLVKRS